MYLCKMIVTAGIYIFKSNKGKPRTTCKKAFQSLREKHQNDVILKMEILRKYIAAESC